jgi:hypothetical protein
MAKQSPSPTDAEVAGSTNLRPEPQQLARAKVFRKGTPEEIAGVVQRVRRRLAGPPLRAGSATLREAEGDSV